MAQNKSISQESISSVMLKSSDSKYSFSLSKGRNHIAIPSLSNAESNLILFTIILNSANNIYLRCYDYLSIKLIPSKAKDILLHKSSLINLIDAASVRIEALVPDVFLSFSFEMAVDQAATPEEPSLKIESDCIYEQTQETDLREVDDSVIKGNKQYLGVKTQRDLQCVICFESKAETYFSYLNACKHEFCSNCISNWAKSSSECPICKENYSKIIPFDSSSHIRSRTIRRKKFRYVEDDTGDEWIKNVAENCMVCDKGDNNYLMLVCDKCEYNICHTYCAGLEFIPEGDWYCRECSRKHKSIKGFKKPKMALGLGLDDYSYMHMGLRSQDKKNVLRRK